MPEIKIRWADNTAELTKNLKQGHNQIEATKASAEKMVQALRIAGDSLNRVAGPLYRVMAQSATAGSNGPSGCLVDSSQRGGGAMVTTGTAREQECRLDRRRFEYRRASAFGHSDTAQGQRESHADDAIVAVSGPQDQPHPPEL